MIRYFPTLFLLGILLLVRCANADTAQVADHVLGPYDQISITVPFFGELERNLNMDTMILADGKIHYPEVGEITAAGKTPRALAEEIKAVLRKTRKNVEVVVSVKEVQSQRVRIVGAVKVGGSFALRPKWKLMDLVAMAGGLSNSPAYVTGRLVRAAGKVIPLEIPKAVTEPDSGANVPLENDDLIILDEREIQSQVHVLGEVNKPGAFDLRENQTILSLLAEAGSVTERAALRKAVILRGSARVPMNLYPALIEAKPDSAVTDFKLQAGDIVFVPEIEEQIAVVGMVASPGYYPMPEKKSDTTVLKALDLAGKPLSEADLRRVHILRTVDGKVKVIPVDITKMLKMGKMDANVQLQAEDILYVPARHAKTSIFELAAPLQALGLLGLRLFP